MELLRTGGPATGGDEGASQYVDQPFRLVNGGSLITPGQCVGDPRNCKSVADIFGGGAEAQALRAVAREGSGIAASRASGSVVRSMSAKTGSRTITDGVAELAGIVYRRTDLNGGKPYIGQSINDARFVKRQAEHARANRNADFRYEELGRAAPGKELDRLEEYWIRREGGPTNLGNPNGKLANQRHQMIDPRYFKDDWWE
jgi:hypothetical protein